MAAVVKEEEVDYSEAEYVDSQYEYLQKHKSEGITLEELRRKRASKRWINTIFINIRNLFQIAIYNPDRLPPINRRTRPQNVQTTSKKANYTWVPTPAYSYEQEISELQEIAVR